MAGRNGGAARAAAWRIGTDTGGTFTDVVAMSEEGELRIGKVPSTPPHFNEGVLSAVQSVDVDPDALALLYHSTTVATNAAITRSGMKTALVTTNGFRDLLEIRRGNREDLYDIMWDPPAPLVLRRDRFAVTEAVSSSGELLEPVDEEALRVIARKLRARGMEAVAICFLNSYLNPANEQRTRDVLSEECPGVYVCASSDVLPEPPEFERTATIVANAYLGPVVTRYLDDLKPAIEGMGYAGDLLLVHSGGAAWTTESAVRLPVRLVNSGPAAGAVAAGALAAATGHGQAISFDMGGTSTDIAVITDGAVREIAAYDLEFGSPIQFPCVDVHCIGAGGGSLAWLDAAGYPHCGPQSAGADPGPAAYGRGGERPTVTDANLVLGRLGEGGLAGGAVDIRRDLAEAAVENVIAAPLRLGTEEAAAGIVRIVNSNMVKALRRATVERGLDPREFTLIAFGGAGPLHAAEVAAELDIPRVMVPAAPGVTSAFGTLFMDVEHAFSRSYIARPSEWDFDSVTRAFEEMEEDARTRLRHEGFDESQIDTRWLIDFRYMGQVRARSVPATKGVFSEEQLGRAIDDFHLAYEAEYKYAMRDFEVESYILRVKGSGRVAKPELVKASAPTTAELPAPREVRPVHFGDGFVDTPVFERDLLLYGHSFEGPAVIDQVDATTVVPVGARAWVDELRSIVIETGGVR